MTSSLDIDSYIDLHTYVGPGLVPRRYTAAEMTASEADALSGIGMWNHFHSTAPILATIDVPDGFHAVGAMLCNRYAGGLNPDGVRASAAVSDLPIIVGFPTIHAENFLEKSEYEVPPEWVDGRIVARESDAVEPVTVTDDAGALVPAAIEVLEAVRETDAILATGYLSWEETVTLVETAHEVGLRKITLTNPIYELIGMPIETQVRLAELPGVYVEQNYAMEYINDIPYERILEQIRALGPENCFLCSDMGQVGNPSPSEGLADCIEEFLDRGVSEAEIETMCESVPRELLDIE